MHLNWLQMCGSCPDTCSFENPIFKNVCRTLVGLFRNHVSTLSTKGTEEHYKNAKPGKIWQRKGNY
jgi:hypothetical protein